MSEDNSHRPIIIKRKKYVKGGHHSSGWKIAMADLMTSLFATFLVLWLLAGSSQSTLNGVAEYFNTPLKVALVGGDQAALSDSLIPGGGSDPMQIDGLKMKHSINFSMMSSDVQETFFSLMNSIQELMQSDEELKKLMDQVRFRLTDEGLKIEFIDSDDLPMFALGSDDLAPYMRKILTKIAPLLDSVNHLMTITGHTDSIAFSAGEKQYSNWELSADRANASRRTLVAGSLKPTLINVVIGMADREPANPSNSKDPGNRRIEILLHGDLKGI